jgi:hypothetical protein
MKTYKLACTTRAGDFIETEISASNMTGAIEAFIYELALTHQVLMSEDVVELDLTEVQE